MYYVHIQVQYLHAIHVCIYTAMLIFHFEITVSTCMLVIHLFIYMYIY